MSIIPDTYSCRLHQHAILSIRGPQSRAFLQGQATCDVEALTPEKAIPGGLCNPQGRLYSSFLITADGSEDLLLRMRRDIVDSTRATLGKYIVFSRAEFDSTEASPVIFGVWGLDSFSALSELVPELTNSALSVTGVDGDYIVQLDDSGQRFECWVSDPANSALMQGLEGMADGDEEDWNKLAILAGDAQIEAAIVDQFIPQMLNFDITGHVNFSKGCYTGQEVVARLHYRGTAKRRALPVEIPQVTELPIPAGTPIFSPDSDQSVGNIVNASGTTAGDAVALAVLTRKLIGTKSLCLGSQSGPELIVGETPYELPD